MADEQIKQLIADGYRELDQRKLKREKEAREQIKQMAAEAGIKVSFNAGRRRKSD